MKRSTRISILALTASLIAPIQKVYAHGGGAGEREAPKKEEPAAKPRVKAAKPNVLYEGEVLKLAGEKVLPDDVLILKCTLGEYAVCRGLDISVYDISGKIIVSGNSGVDGFTGFEGLRDKARYFAKIENPKYTGEIEAMSGSMNFLNGDRKN